MIKSDYDKFRNSVVNGCAEIIFDEDYIQFFLSKNNMNYMDDDTVNYFKTKDYSNSIIFKILFTKSLNINYGNKIDKDLLKRMLEIVVSNDKMAVSTLMAYTCLETIDEKINLKIFENRFDVLSYFVENQFCFDTNKINFFIDDYLLLKQFPNLFCVQNNNEELFKSKSEISNIINQINQLTNINNNNFEDACIIYENKLLDKPVKKMQFIKI